MSEEILPSGKIRVHVEPSLLVLVPNYLSRRLKEIALLQSALLTGDFESIRIIGHKLSGNAGTYGFDQMSRMGLDIESAAKGQDALTLERLTRLLTNYLERIEIAS